MLNAAENYRLLMEIDANRRFLLLAMQSNPPLMASWDEHARQVAGMNIKPAEAVESCVPRAYLKD